MKHQQPFSLFLLVAGLVLLSACKDIIEPDISKKTVQLNAPGDHYKSAVYSTNFWWEEVPDALSYHLQVVTPKFDSIASLVLDTIVKTTRFTTNLSPGNYEWRVRAENGSYKTVYSASRGFVIFQSTIKTQKVQLLAPANNALTSQLSATFSWGDLYGATKYHLEIDTNNFVNENTVVYNQSVPGQQVSFNFPKDQVYQWRVRAENDTAQAQWSIIQTITYDHTPPAKVTLLTPANDQTATLPVALQWNTAATASKYKLYVFKSDGLTPYNSSFPINLTTTNYSFNLGSLSEKIYWRVTALDAAGNESITSDSRDFVIQVTSMKNKAMTYVLIVLVVGVWGLISYRVVSAAGGNGDPLSSAALPVSKGAYNDYATTPDTAKLVMNYRDPFGQPLHDTATAVSKKQPVRPLKMLAVAPLNWSFIKYAGFVRNPGSGKLLAILLINGKNTTLAEGETADQVKLIKNMKDSVKVSYRSQTHFITMTTTPL